eukprot:c14447_g1_i1.p2 GENE.c14447_g1_i1~~c14447_g1_i1.p2  ORF type:complete len:133 (-),score=22.53 c14447_g1_i1:29-427(-)
MCDAQPSLEDISENRNIPTEPLAHSENTQAIDDSKNPRESQGSNVSSDNSEQLVISEQLIAPDDTPATPNKLVAQHSDSEKNTPRRFTRFSFSLRSTVPLEQPSSPTPRPRGFSLFRPPPRFEDDVQSITPR